jgi:hypothetical protein
MGTTEPEIIHQSETGVRLDIKHTKPAPYAVTWNT